MCTVLDCCCIVPPDCPWCVQIGNAMVPTGKLDLQKQNIQKQYCRSVACACCGSIVTKYVMLNGFQNMGTERCYIVRVLLAESLRA